MNILGTFETKQNKTKKANILVSQVKLIDRIDGLIFFKIFKLSFYVKNKTKKPTLPPFIEFNSS